MDLYIGYKIKKIRELKGLTQKQIADNLSISQGTYSDIESGIIPMNNSRLEQIAKILEVDPNTILGFDKNIVFEKCTQSGYINTNNIMEKEAISEIIKRLELIYERRIEELKKELEDKQKKIDSLLQSKNR
jgi:transcriptional regulator with XRE-family HTH domain